MVIKLASGWISPLIMAWTLWKIIQKLVTDMITEVKSIKTCQNVFTHRYNWSKPTILVFLVLEDISHDQYDWWHKLWRRWCNPSWYPSSNQQMRFNFPSLNLYKKTNLKIDQELLRIEAVKFPKNIPMLKMNTIGKILSPRCLLIPSSSNVIFRFAASCFSLIFLSSWYIFIKLSIFS